MTTFFVALAEAISELSEEDAALLFSLVESGGDVALDLTKKGERPAYGFERGGESWWAMQHGSASGTSDRMKRRLKHLEKRGLVKQGADGKVAVTKRGHAAMKKYERGSVARDAARRGGVPIGKTGKPAKLKPGEKMVFGVVRKVG